MCMLQHSIDYKIIFHEYNSGKVNIEISLSNLSRVFQNINVDLLIVDSQQTYIAKINWIVIKKRREFNEQ